MTTPENLDTVRRAALEMAERSRRQWLRAMVLFSAVEGIGWISYVTLAWFEFSASVLIAVATLILYSMMFGWAVALREQIDVGTQRVLKAIDTLAGHETDRRDGGGSGS
jgi:hypothetical protein